MNLINYNTVCGARQYNNFHLRNQCRSVDFLWLLYFKCFSEPFLERSRRKFDTLIRVVRWELGSSTAIEG